MMEKIRPLHDKVWVKRLPEQEKTDGGLFIPENAKEKPQRGKVVAVGTGRLVDGKTQPLAVNVGDVVFFGKYAGTETSEDHLIVREDDILGVVER